MEKEIKIDLIRCLKAVVKGWYWILLCVLIFGGAAFALKPNETTTYSATATMYSAVTGSYTQTMQGVNIMRSYATIVKSNKVAERASVLVGGNKISSSEIIAMVSATPDDDSALLRITARGTDPYLTIEVVNAVAESFAIEAKNITGDDSLQVLDKAESVRASSTSAFNKYMLIAILAGVLLPAIIICLKEIFSDSVYHVADATIDGELDIIGIIPNGKEL